MLRASELITTSNARSLSRKRKQPVRSRGRQIYRRRLLLEGLESRQMLDGEPTVTIDQAVSQADPTSADPIHFTAEFSEAVTGFSDADVSLGGTAGGTLSAVISPVGVDGTTYDIAVTGMISNGTVIATISEGVATDVDGNLNLPSTSTDNVVNFVLAGAGDTIGLYDPFGNVFYLDALMDGTLDGLIVADVPNSVPPNWIPIAGDWDGDGTDTIGLYDPYGSVFYLNNETDGSLDNLITVNLPQVPPHWIPIAGDWDGDGVDTIGLYDKTKTTFYLNNETDGSTDNQIEFSLPDVPARWKPVAGDWDGDGVDTVGLYDKTTNTFRLNNETDGSVDNEIVFTTPTVPPSWLPIAGDWDNDGVDTVGLYDRNRHTFYLNNETDGSVDKLIVFRTPSVPRTWLPIVGDWNGSEGASASAAIVAAFPTGEGEGFTSPMDIDGNGEITPLDALGVINFMNSYPADQFSQFADATSLFDATGDGMLSPMDVLVIANHLNRQTDAETNANVVLALPATGTNADPTSGDAAGESSPDSSTESDGSSVPAVRENMDWDEVLAVAAPNSGADDQNDNLDDWLTDLDGILTDIATAIALEKQS